jgi:phosphoglycerate dehydrogenase-like enzyme
MAQKERGVWERVTGGGELAGKTVGIVGLGAIGTRVAELAQAYRMTVIGTKRDPATAPDAVDEAFGPAGLGELLDRADYLVLACPLTEETEGLIGSTELRRMDDEAVLVNIARGEVVDQDALVRSLQYHSIRGAGLDVFAEEPLSPDSELWDLSNVVITPHNAGSTPRYAERLAGIFAANYERYQTGGVEALENRVR